MNNVFIWELFIRNVQDKEGSEYLYYYSCFQKVLSTLEIMWANEQIILADATIINLDNRIKNLLMFLRYSCVDKFCVYLIEPMLLAS